jgi:DNA mismatch repair protein MutL
VLDIGVPIIQLLPPGLVNQIAAGEVVERPASVVKELVENALDAGARALQIDIDDGGTTRVRVSDDGCGMRSDDALLALERHATSKLRDFDGLSAIATMGFRGEALPAIASVSRFRLDTSASDGTEPGMRVVVEGGSVVEQGAIARPRGTTVEVRDLFFNTPARRKFMRAPAAEAAQCTEAVVRLALGRTDVAFTYRSGGRAALVLPARSTLRDRAVGALGREAAARMVELDATRGEIRVHGGVTSPDHSEATSRSVYIFVNGRFVRDRAAAHALLRAYAGVLPPGRHPAAVLYIELPADRVDVNVHPQKLEVRFAEARAVYEALHRAAADALRSAPWLRHRPTPSAAPWSGGDHPPVPLAGEDAAGAAADVLGWSRSRGDGGPSAAYVGAFRAAGPEPVVNRAFGFAERPDELEGPAGERAAGYFGALRYIGQHSRTYLLCEAPGGALVVIDQHASHERLLFHRFSEAWRARAVVVQPLLVPQVVTLPPGPARVIEANAAELARVGLELEPFGGDSIAVKGAPAALAGVDLAKLLVDLAQQIEETERGSAVDSAVHDLLATLACHAAVRANQDLTAQEARALLDGLDAIDFKGRCPHGRPVVFELGLEDLERRVGRR